MFLFRNVDYGILVVGQNMMKFDNLDLHDMFLVRSDMSRRKVEWFSHLFC